MRHVRFVCTLTLVLLAVPTCVPTRPLATKQVAGLIPIDRFPELAVIHAPPSVPVNQPITLTVMTYGSSSCTTSDGAAIDVTGLVATITPLDRIPRGSVACTADLASHPRAVQLTFGAPGEATIRVIGRTFDGARTLRETTLTITP